MNLNQQKIDLMKKRMEKVSHISPTMCTAKWMQCTLYLHNGYNHSCHHPAPHQCDIEDVRKNPSALHNTSFKKEQRKGLLAGSQVEECKYCWNIEKIGGDYISDRVYKSTDEEWSMPFLDQAQNATDDIDPSYLEVIFDNKCNCRCLYCSPDISSAWYEEVQKHGAYDLSFKLGDLEYFKSVGKVDSKYKDEYQDAFWQWFPKIYPKLKCLRISGGEPLLDQNTWKLFEFIENNPNQDLVVVINSNMSVGRITVDRLIYTLEFIQPLVKSVQLFTSCEAYGEDAEYIRYGMNYKKFMGNIDHFLEKTSEEIKVSFMITFNMLSVFSFFDFMNDLLQLRIKFNKDTSYNRIPFIISYLSWPTFLSMSILPLHLKEMFAAKVKCYIELNRQPTKARHSGYLYLEEVNQFERLVALILKKVNEKELQTDRRDSVAFFKESDRRKGNDFLKVFPELTEYISKYS